ncbi:MAG: hypothetical protein WBR26_15140 [Candidatus Acidiferrum sp.]
MPTIVARLRHFYRSHPKTVAAIGTVNFPLVFVLLLASLLPARACASVGVVLNESLDESMDRITGTGHTAVYFSNICADSPVRLRLCQPGEQGSVLSTYINIGEDRPFEWNVVPLNIYLYGVEDPENRPIFGSRKIKHLLEERYRRNYLTGYCMSVACQTSKNAEWREMVAATMIRSVYIFAVDTTVEQDRAFIAEFNAAPNKNRFNGITRNCADFTRDVVNSYFPHAVNRDYVNDFGMTSPKAVAHTFTRYALRHPESNFRVLHFAQVPGTIKRSSEVRAGTEQLFRSKKFLIPMILFADHELPVVVASYLLTGRFNPEHTFEEHPALQADAANSGVPIGEQVAESGEARVQLIGTRAGWKDYRKEFHSLAEQNKSVIAPHDLSRFFKYLDQNGTASVDQDGSVWMELEENGEPLKVGVSANNVLAANSNPQMTSKVLLARTSRLLKSPKHSRETMLEFKEDWATLQHVAAEVDTNSNLAALANRPHPFMKTSNGDSAVLFNDFAAEPLLLP